MISADKDFEDEVRRVARLLWPDARYDGASQEEGRERDGVFETREFINIVECTTSQGQKKAYQDGQKIAKLIKRFQARRPDRFVKGWFITKNEPTADQRSAIKEISKREKVQIASASFDQFRSQLVDARDYLISRDRYPFGSIRDPASNNSDYAFEYFELPIVDDQDNSISVADILESLRNGGKSVLLGDYGAGKSSTLRELYRSLRRLFWDGRMVDFPVMLNLRDHHGQTDPVEALERHARKVGFRDPAALVRGWRAGYVSLLLDGFDEIASAGWIGRTQTLRSLRYKSMELVRELVRQSPKGTGIVIAGRAHYFDSRVEMRDALGLGGGGFKIHTLREFSEDKVTEFLRSLGWEGEIPSWLPSRPLLLSYLAQRGLIEAALSKDEAISPAQGWDTLLDRISEREAQIEAGIDPATVRRIIEELAMRARASFDGLGPLSPTEIVATFEDVCHFSPDDRGAVLLQRLPGLGGEQDEDGGRVFIDRDFVQAARGGALFRVIESPYDIHYDSESWQSAVDNLAATVAALKAEKAGYGQGKLIAAVEHLSTGSEAHRTVLIADLVQVIWTNGCRYDGRDIFISGVLFDEIILESCEADTSRLEIQDCVVSTLTLESDVAVEALPKFVRCHFGMVEGRTGKHDLTQEKFIECTFDGFESSARTTSGIMGLELPLGTKVVLSILKKLYAQAGSGRKESAMFRGLDPRAQELVKCFGKWALRPEPRQGVRLCGCL